MLTFIVFVVSSMLIVVQLASAQLTPRVILRAYTGWQLKLLLTAFTFTYTYTVAVARQRSPVTHRARVEAG